VKKKRVVALSTLMAVAQFLENVDLGDSEKRVIRYEFNFILN
jgi:hypothetical protein